MIISVWRYSHLSLAVSSFLLLTLASITGIVLAFEPISEKAKGYRAKEFNTTTLAQAIPALKSKYKSIQELSVDDNSYVILSYTDEQGNNQKAYINPVTGEKLGTLKEQSAFFQWVTSLHRSLFLHETGRIIMGVLAFLLILIVLSGIVLVIQRQKGITRFFAGIERGNFAQYYHVLFGRVALIPMLAIALTGTYLSIARFGIVDAKKITVKVDTDNIESDPEIKPGSFKIFQQTPLSQVQTIQFPFSDFPEDYFTLKLKDKEVAVNQFTGGILAQQDYSKAYQLNNFSLRWHTGRSGSVWAIVLAITAGYILFFIYSGFVITFKRRANRMKNKYKADDCSIIILVGSENGTTFRFASSVYKQLLGHGEKVYLTDMDKYAVFPKADHIVIMTSTYGLGDPPSNAQHFAARLAKYPQPQQVRFSVLGFGSRSYTNFCQFAYDADHLMRQQQWATPVTDVITVNDRSPQDFSAWLTIWSQEAGFQLAMARELLEPNTEGLEKLTVLHRTAVDADDAFLVRLKTRRSSKVASGDLLAIYPKNDHRERLYSIGKVDKEVQLSVKLHAKGLGSGFLNALKAGDTIKARIVKNKHFNFPHKVSQVVMISNGTGIAPFLGMIDENKRKVHCRLYCGFRTHASFDLYRPFLTENIASQKLEQYRLALSREGEQCYVSDLVEKDSEFFFNLLASGGTVMICGSLSMQKDVMEVLEKICQQNNGSSIETFQAAGQVLTDCY
ncbi:MAG: PepSY domain-containing protein [Chitinophagaceae bacterium]